MIESLLSREAWARCWIGLPFPHQRKREFVRPIPPKRNHNETRTHHDIHEQVEYLRGVLDRFSTEDVDPIIVIGDLFEMGKRIEATCRVLTGANAIGVWDNHDYGLCVVPNDELRSRYGDLVIDFMTSLRPRLDFADWHFTHVYALAANNRWVLAGGRNGKAFAFDRLETGQPTALLNTTARGLALWDSSIPTKKL